MRLILDVKIGEDGRVSFKTGYNPLKGMNLYQRVFVALMFEPRISAVRRTLTAVRLLGLADVCASDNPALCMRMFEKNAERLDGVMQRFKRSLGGNLNFKAGA